MAVPPCGRPWDRALDLPLVLQITVAYSYSFELSFPKAIGRTPLDQASIIKSKLLLRKHSA